MSLKRLLFVDDESQVLDALRNLLRRERHRWEMEFATSGAEALEVMERSPADVIISDMRMPGMDGAALLAQVKARWPRTARLILSGHAEREAILRALPVTHQFLSKPCDVGVLRVAIERTLEVQTLLHDEAIERVVGQMERLPSLPRTYLELTAAANDMGAGVSDFTRIIQRDPAMSAKALQLVNSAYFGCAQQVLSVNQAVSYLGIELLKGLALTTEIFASVEERPVPGFSLQRLQDHSLLVAKVARRLVPSSKLGEEVYAAALLHDIGRAVLALGLPTQTAAIVAQSLTRGCQIHEVEREVLGVTHAEVGGYLLGVWGLPFTLVESAAYHHSPSALAAGPCELLAALHAADVGVERFEAARRGETSSAQLDGPFLKRAGLEVAHERLREVCVQEAKLAA
jgi:HD-like signal output (HDOD) protein/CheY-like chemotaxis protein